MSVNGILLIDKPAGMTSHDVVSRVRRTLRTRRVGHAGTLDPDATGVLVLCVGQATRLLEYIAADDKTYEGTLCFGVGTTTDDAVGEISATKDASHLSATIVASAVQRWTGEVLQQVPAYSAVHIEGKRAYELARQGISFERPSRQVIIHHFDLFDLQVKGIQCTATFRVACSKGTYIRSLCRDLGETLSLPAHMQTLRRIQSGRYHIDECVTLTEWMALEQPEQFVRPAVEAVRELPQLQVPEDVTELEFERLLQGQAITLSLAKEDAYAIAQVGDEIPLALLKLGQVAAICISHIDADRLTLKPKKVLWQKESSTDAGT